MIDEGYVKYNCRLLPAPPPNEEKIRSLNHWRNTLHDLGLIGQYPNGIGYGNVSQRDVNPQRFIISATKTGAIPKLAAEHYTRVIDYDWEKNSVTCEGVLPASSETLTHGAIYDSDGGIQSVFHIHHLELWQALLYRVPTTRDDVAYGTPQMARELIRIVQENYREKSLIVAMSGHEEGVIAFGASLEETGNLLLRYYQELITGNGISYIPSIPD